MDPVEQSRRLHLPPPGRPYWKAPASDARGLQYLSWGLRWFGDHPLPLSCRSGWTYFVVLDGAPTFHFADGGTSKAQAGTGLIFHPDCIRGVRDAKGRRSRMLAWIWADPPAHPDLRPEPGRHVAVRLSPEALRRVEKSHAVCRQAALVRSRGAALELARERLELDLAFLRAREGSGPGREAFRLERAIRFLRDNPRVMDPVRRLCEHLQVSPATLKRLFRARLGESPRAYAHAQRMRRAARLLARGARVKKVAFALGYAHPNDFSRAYHRHLAKRRKGGKRTSAASGRAGSGAPGPPARSAGSC